MKGQIKTIYFTYPNIFVFFLKYFLLAEEKE